MLHALLSWWGPTLMQDRTMQDDIIYGMRGEMTIPIFVNRYTHFWKKSISRERDREKTKSNSNKVLFSRNLKMRLEESMCSHTLASFFFTFLQFQFFFYDRGWYASLSSILLTIVMVIADFYQPYFLNELGIFLYIVKSAPPWGFMAPRSLEWAYNLLRWVR